MLPQGYTSGWADNDKAVKRNIPIIKMDFIVLLFLIN